jgi:hypothetical protein
MKTDRGRGIRRKKKAVTGRRNTGNGHEGEFRFVLFYLTTTAAM